MGLKELAAYFAEDIVVFFSKESRDLHELPDLELEPAKVTH